MPVNSIFGVFAKSPIKPIQLHMDKVAVCSELLLPFFEASSKNDWVEAEKVRKQISQYEKQADELKRELRLTLPKGLFMPIDRADLLELVNRQDKIANTANPNISNEAKKNRLLLKSVMEKYGFQNLWKEWWHYTLIDEPFRDEYFNFIVK